MRSAGDKWGDIAAHFGVSHATIHYIKIRYAIELHAIQNEDVAPRPVIEPEIVVEDGLTIKRYPAMWAEGAHSRNGVRPSVRGKRSD